MFGRKIDYARAVIAKAYERFGSLALSWSGGKDSTVMLHLVLEYAREHGLEEPLVIASDPIPFRETEEYCRRVIEKWGIKRYVFWSRDLLKPEHLEHISEPGLDKLECCYWLKVRPLNEFIESRGIDGLFVAIRWDEHPERAKEKFFSPRKNPEHYRIHPLLHFTLPEIWKYVLDNRLPVNPLYLKGYLSLGCKPCTFPVVRQGFKSIGDIYEYVCKGTKERAGRSIDKERIMERLRRLGYF